MFEWIYRLWEQYAGGDDPSGPWPLDPEYRDWNVWP